MGSLGKMGKEREMGNPGKKEQKVFLLKDSGVWVCPLVTLGLWLTPQTSGVWRKLLRASLVTLSLCPLEMCEAGLLGDSLPFILKFVIF